MQMYLILYLERLKNDQQGNNQDHQSKLIRSLRPISFLKDFNLTPPIVDLFQSKVKEKKLRHMGLFCSFQDQNLPEKYPKEVPQELKSSTLFKTIKQYFEKRPIWLKNVLLSQLEAKEIEFKPSELKSVLQYLAYYFRDGPWKNSYVKFGYSAKTDRNSIIYQTITIKIKHKQVEDYENETKKESTTYDPTFTVLNNNNKFIRTYQLCDINDSKVKQIVALNVSLKEKDCDATCGWLTKEQHRKIFRCLRNKLKRNV